MMQNFIRIVLRRGLMYKCKFGERKKEKTRFIYHMVYEGKENVEADRLG